MTNKTYCLVKVMFIALIISNFFSNFLLAQPAESPWPMYKHDAQHTSRSQYSGPQYPYPGWRIIKESGFFQPNPIVGKDGNIYMRANTEPYVQLWAIDPNDGSTHWIFECGVDEKHVKASPAAAADGTIYFAVTDTDTTAFLYAITSEGNLKWKYPLATGSPGAPQIGNDGSIYLRTKTHLYSISSEGNMKWEKRVKFYSASAAEPLISPDNTIYYCTRNTLFKIDDNGNQLWKIWVELTWSSDYIRGLAIDETTNIHILTSTIYYYIINADGSLKKKNYISTSENFALGTDGTFYTTQANQFEWDSSDPRIQARNIDGSLLWSYYQSNASVSDIPVIDSNGRIYVIVGNELVALNKDGSVHWEITVDWLDDIIVCNENSLFISDDKSCYVIFDLSAAEVPDLAINASEIKFNPLVARPGNKVEVQVPIHERTGNQGASCTCTLYLTQTAKLLDSCPVYVPAGGLTNAGCQFQTYYNWETGYYDITVEVIDASPVEENTGNNRAQVTYRLVIDNTAPILRFISPQNAAVFPTIRDKISISFEDEEDGSGILLESFQITNSKPLGQATGSIIVPANTNFAEFFTVDDRNAILEVSDSTSFPTGQNILSASITDYSGNRTSAMINFIASYLTVSTPQNNSLVKSSPIELKGFAISPFIASVRVNDIQVPVDSSTFRTEVHLNSGLNRISVVGYDQNNSVAKEISLNITLDDSAPIVKIQKPISEQSFSYSPIQVKGTVEEKESSLMGVFINGINAEVSDGTFTLGDRDDNGLEIGPGSFWIKAIAIDSSGNQGVDSVRITGVPPSPNRLYLKGDVMNWFPYPPYSAGTTQGYSHTFILDQQSWKFPLTGDIKGSNYTVVLLAGCLGLGSAEMKGELFLRHQGSDELLASTPQFTGSMAGYTPIGYQTPSQKWFNLSGKDPNSVEGDTLIFKVTKVGGDRAGLIFTRELNMGHSYI
ncbi:MAG: PQQ-binding-like beta-propeller repeat protein, partial [Candidatus Lokiarchaeota archaeon]|nr:PQQ-binding-like beta-propeller repeat protein [Candidatus Lokiarchaeota archaeon]